MLRFFIFQTEFRLCFALRGRMGCLVMCYNSSEGIISLMWQGEIKVNKGIGIDIIEIERVKEALDRRPRLRERIFSPEEIAYCQGKRCPATSFAARFAAKEAVRKACSDGFGDEIMPWREIEIVSETGKPRVRLSGKSARLAEKKGITNFLVSLSHCKTYACAVVLAIGDQRSEDLPLERMVDDHEAGKGC